MKEVASLINRIEEIKKKGFRMNSIEDADQKYTPTDFSKIKVGLQTLNDATLRIGDYHHANPRYGDKSFVLRAIAKQDLEVMREISNFFYRTSGIYFRLCRYMAYLYKYDWFVTPFIDNCEGLLELDEKETERIAKNTKKQFSNFFNVLRYLEKFSIKKTFGEIALEVVRNGCYYGYIIYNNNRLAIQELPISYCRSRFKVNGRYAVEFNMGYFKKYKTEEDRQNILKLFPPEFKKGWNLYKAGKLQPTFPGDTEGWYLLDVKSAVKFNLNDEDFPIFIAVIPAILDLDYAKGLDRKKMAQKLLKIIIQKMPLDKNGDLVFDVDEATQLHNNVVNMLGKAIGVDVLTTFADVDVADMSDRSNITSADELQKVERNVFNEAGVPQLQFNSDSNIALNNSILNDEASMLNLIAQFEEFLNLILEPYNKAPKRIYYQAQILPTTIYNYKELAKLYKEQAQMGYSKMLPQIALGQTQSSVLANAYFENDVLDLVRVFVPPLTSNTMNAEALANRSAVTSKQPKSSDGEGAGRPEKEDNEKSEKTIQNLESM